MLKLHSYRAHVTHELQKPDTEKRLHCCRWFTHCIQGGEDILDEVFFGDEACSHQTGYINSQNSRIRSAENLHTFHERPLHSLRFGVWCDASRQRIISPIFFSETIRAERNQELVINSVSLLEVDEQVCWFQQDGATVHTANSTMQMLSEFFGGRIIS
jgi:hypothetical protein